MPHCRTHPSIIMKNNAPQVKIVHPNLYVCISIFNDTRSKTFWNVEVDPIPFDVKNTQPLKPDLYQYKFIKDIQSLSRQLSLKSYKGKPGIKVTVIWAVATASQSLATRLQQPSASQPGGPSACWLRTDTPRQPLPGHWFTKQMHIWWSQGGGTTHRYTMRACARVQWWWWWFWWERREGVRDRKPRSRGEREAGRQGVLCERTHRHRGAGRVGAVTRGRNRSHRPPPSIRSADNTVNNNTVRRLEHYYWYDASVNVLGSAFTV